MVKIEKADTPISGRVSFFMIKSLAFLHNILWQLDLALAGLKILDALADKVKHLPVRRAPLVFGNVMQLIVQLGIDLKPEVFVVFVSHNISP